MFKKIKELYYKYKLTRQLKTVKPKVQPERELFTKQEMLEMYNQGVANGFHIGYAEGKDDGISIAKNAATNQLKELIWQQNKNNKMNNQPSVPQVPSPPQRW